MRDEEAAELTKALENEPVLPKRRWAYALKDTSTPESAKVRVKECFFLSIRETGAQNKSRSRSGVHGGLGSGEGGVGGDAIFTWF